MLLSRRIDARNVRSRPISALHFPSRCVREWMPQYEDEGSQRGARGAVAVDSGAWWSVLLEAPIERGPAPPVLVRLRLQRHGARVSPLVDGVVEVHLPVRELPAVIVALQGVAAQARRDGII